MDEKGLGQRLQAARLRAGMTQQMLCQKADLSYSTLTKIERGAIKSPSIFTIQHIATALDVGLDELLGGASRETPNHVKKQRSKNGVCLDMKSGGTANGTRIWMWPCNGTAAQKWTAPIIVASH